MWDYDTRKVGGGGGAEERWDVLPGRRGEDEKERRGGGVGDEAVVLLVVLRTPRRKEVSWKTRSAESADWQTPVRSLRAWKRPCCWCVCCAAQRTGHPACDLFSARVFCLADSYQAAEGGGGGLFSRFRDCAAFRHRAQHSAAQHSGVGFAPGAPAFSAPDLFLSGVPGSFPIALLYGGRQ